MCILTTALGLPEDISQRSVLALEIQDFSKGFHIVSNRFVKLAVTVHHRI